MPPMLAKLEPVAFVEELLAEYGRDADAYAPPWCGWPHDETLTPLPLVLWGVLWPRHPRELATRRARAFVRAVVAARDGIAPPPRVNALGLDLAQRTLSTVRAFERMLRSEAANKATPPPKE